MPAFLVETYLVNGTNLKCPMGTESERGAWCIGMCTTSPASRETVSILNPVTDVIQLTSLKRSDLSEVADNLGSLAERLENEGKIARRRL